MKTSSIFAVGSAVIAALAAPAVFAHPGHDIASGALAGLAHPLTGIDHLIALLSAGALFALAPTRTRWRGVAALLLALAAGAGIGLSGVALPGAEWMIALSVLAAGLLLLKSGGQHPGWLTAGVALFALFHGYAHGIETSGAAAAFVGGFLACSLALVLASLFAARFYIERRTLRLAAGTGAAATAVALLLQLAM